ncbi:uncharacterized protein Tco025E_07754 [Trypanosoma conorhini]|uniref:Ubiquitin-like domain-containing protein n=1 Tax=Trypanosoma conorhini TaxID=83891 RepID=A0A422NJF8_9TRYP|nr:uncharacterized protein Tco025E_07754 [Trypanosoma conorhini]RNF05581.1 hypothetical protein Tco025E_07754 [Trypanosoma conorhini]
MTGGEERSVQCVYVLSDIDGFKYKLVMEGDVRLLTTTKAKRYLQNATGLGPQHQELSFEGRILQDDECGGDVGLVDGAVLQLRRANTGAAAAGGGDGGGGRVNRPQSRSRSEGSAARRGGSSVVDAFSYDFPSAGMPTPLQCSRRRDDLKDGENSKSPPPKFKNYGGKHMDYEYRRLELENARLESCLVQLERRLANATSDWRLQEEIDELKSTIAQLLQEKEAAKQSAEENWRAKEDELVKEIDLLREERRKLRREQTSFENEQGALGRSLEGQIRSQQKRLLEQEALLAQQSQQRHPGAMSLAEKVECSLNQLSLELNIPQLHLDDNDTCVVPLGDEASILITLDSATERLFMYAVIANSLPSNTEDRLQLFEMLLEGALLGREMAGGGVGVCSRNNLIIMHVCVEIGHVNEYALASVTRPFMTSVQQWLETVKAVTTH